MIGRIGRLGTAGRFSLAPSAAFVGVLDLVGVASAGAYSVARRLTGTYTGPLITVRRSTGGDAQDIPMVYIAPAVDGWILDTTALMNFVGSGDGFVVRVYDQSGLGRHAEQTTASAQPRIVIAGALQTDGGRPTMRFAGAQRLVTPIVPDRTAFPNLTVSAVYRCTNLTGDQAIWGADNGSWDRFQLLSFVTNPGVAYGISTGSSAVSQFGLLGNTAQNIYSAVLATGVANGSNVFVNSIAGTSFTEVVGTAHAALALGALSPTAASGLVGTQSEFIVFPNALSATQRQVLETDQARYYGVLLNGVLDSVGAASAGAYSVARRLSNAYTGPLIRVRRPDAQNTEQDIGYTTAGALDTDALMTFVGGGDGFVTRVYDQSGLGRNAVQTTPASQPRIVVGGVLQTINGRPAPVYNGVAFGQALATPSRTLPTTVTIFGVASPTEVTGQRMWLGGSTGQIFKFGYTTQDFARVNGQTATSALTYATGVPSVRSGRLNGSVMTAWRNGTQAAQLVTANPTPQTAAPWIGGAGDGQMWPGHIGDVILFDAALTDTQRQLVERDLGAFFNITVA